MAIPGTLKVRRVYGWNGAAMRVIDVHDAGELRGLPAQSAAAEVAGDNAQQADCIRPLAWSRLDDTPIGALRFDEGVFQAVEVLLNGRAEGANRQWLNNLRVLALSRADRGTSG